MMSLSLESLPSRAAAERKQMCEEGIKPGGVEVGLPECPVIVKNMHRAIIDFLSQ
jgi:hypothetical protein